MFVDGSNLLIKHARMLLIIVGMGTMKVIMGAPHSVARLPSAALLSNPSSLAGAGAGLGLGLAVPKGLGSKLRAEAACGVGPLSFSVGGGLRGCNGGSCWPGGRVLVHLGSKRKPNLKRLR